MGSSMSWWTARPAYFSLWARYQALLNVGKTYHRQKLCRKTGTRRPGQVKYAKLTTRSRLGAPPRVSRSCAKKESNAGNEQQFIRR